MRIVLVANPTAQSGRAVGTIDRVRELLERAGLPHDLVATEPQGATIGVVRQLVDKQQARLIIAMGGDGTFAEVAKGVMRSKARREVTLGMLPMGTANDQGKSFGLEAGPDELERNVSVLARGVTAWLDVGRFEKLDPPRREELFFDSASIGFSAAVLQRRNRDRDVVDQLPIVREIYRDQLLYTGAALSTFLDTYVLSAKFDLEVELDEGTRDTRTIRYERLLDVVIKNTPVYCGEWILSPDARYDDGAFELVPIAGRRDLTSKLLATLRDGLFGEEDLREVGIEHSRPVRASSMRLTVHRATTADPPPVQLDGEELGAGDRFLIKVLPRQLRIIVA